MNLYVEKGIAEISRTHKEEIGLGELALHTEGKRDKKAANNLRSMCKWLAEPELGGILKMQSLLTDTKNRKSWKAMS